MATWGNSCNRKRRKVLGGKQNARNEIELQKPDFTFSRKSVPPCGRSQDAAFFC